jgi:hypothetical protein
MAIVCPHLYSIYAETDSKYFTSECYCGELETPWAGASSLFTLRYLLVSVFTFPESRLMCRPRLMISMLSSRGCDGISCNRALHKVTNTVCFLVCLLTLSHLCIVSDYGLDDRAIGVRSPAGAKDFSCSPCVQTGSGAHPASCTMGTGGPFPGGKARPGRDADHSPPSSAEVKNE